MHNAGWRRGSTDTFARCADTRREDPGKLVLPSAWSSRSQQARHRGRVMSSRSANQRQCACLVELTQRVLHPPRDELIALVRIAARAAELLAQVYRREHLDRDLRGQRKASREV